MGLMKIFSAPLDLQYVNTVAVDMESYAVMYVVKQVPTTRAVGLVIKSVFETLMDTLR